MNLFNDNNNYLALLISFLIIPYIMLLIIAKVNLLIINRLYQKQLSHSANNKKFVWINIIFYTIFTTILLQSINYFLPFNFLIFHLKLFAFQFLSLFTIIYFVQITIVMTFAFNNKNNFGYWHKVRMVLFNLIFILINIEFLSIAWVTRSLLFSSFINFAIILMVYSAVIVFVLRLFNSEWNVFKFLVIKTSKILNNKKEFYINKNYQNALNIDSRSALIANLWAFKQKTNEKKSQKTILNLASKTKDFIFEAISWRNVTLANDDKDQFIIVNGWKISKNQ